MSNTDIVTRILHAHIQGAKGGHWVTVQVKLLRTVIAVLIDLQAERDRFRGEVEELRRTLDRGEL